MVDVSTQTPLNNELLSLMNNIKLEYVDMINDDPAIVSIGRSNEIHQNKSQKINVVDQLISQPNISFDLLPKHFQPKLITTNQNSPSLMHNKNVSKRSRVNNRFRYRYNGDSYTRQGHRVQTTTDFDK